MSGEVSSPWRKSLRVESGSFPQSSALQPDRLSPTALELMNQPSNELLFSAASLWEIAIKSGLGRADFQMEPRVLRRALLDNGYGEVPITSEHAVAVDSLPPSTRIPSIASW